MPLRQQHLKPTWAAAHRAEARRMAVAHRTLAERREEPPVAAALAIRTKRTGSPAKQPGFFFEAMSR
jgi:hypothetical protein